MPIIDHILKSNVETMPITLDMNKIFWNDRRRLFKKSNTTSIKMWNKFTMSEIILL